MLPRLLLLLLPPLLLALPANSHAEDDLRELIMQLTSEIKELKTQVSQSNARIDDLEQKLKKSNEDKLAATASPLAQTQAQAGAPSASQSPASASPAQGGKPVVTAGDVSGSIKIPGTDTSIGIGGFVKLDALFSSTGMGLDTRGNQRLEVAEIPVGPIAEGNDDQISLHAKESRFWFKSFTPTRWGDINTYLETDFYGDPRLDTYTPRLRHAYGSLGNFLAGQTWSTFVNNLAFADTLDNNNTVGGLLSLRQPLIRWTQPFSVGKLPMEWQVAVESPRTRVWDSRTNSMTTVNTNHYPDLVARVNFNPNWGNISVAALGRQLQYTPTALNEEKTVWGGAVSVAGKISTIGADNIRFMLNYGDGLGRYAVNNFFADAVADNTGRFDTITAYGGMLAYQHWWNKAWRSTLAYGFARADQPNYAGAANQQTQSLHANLLWSPISQTTIGLEYIYANRELVNGQDGELQRVQFSTRFNF